MRTPAATSKAISPLITMVFTILFGVTMLVIILNTVNPLFGSARDTTVVNDAFQNLEMMNSVITSVSSEAQGSTRTVSLSVSGGTYVVNSTYDWLYFQYDPSQPMQLSGQQGNARVLQGLKFMDTFDSYADDSPSSNGWTNMSGNWSFSSYKYLGKNGTSYHNISSPIQNWKFSASITNVSGTTGGEVFALPTSPTSLVSYWTFDESSGATAYDWSGNRNNGTLTSMNTTGNSTSGWQAAANCKAGGSCLMFDGVNDYVDCGNGASLNFGTADFSLSAWFNISSLPSAWKTVASKGDSGSNGYGIEISSGNQYTCSIQATGGSNYHLSSTTPTLNVWHNIICVFDRDANLYMYVDGILIANNTANILSNSGSVNIGTNLMIGAHAAGTWHFNGIIDEVMVFNRSLSADEVAALYETSAKKIIGSGGSQSISSKTPNPAIVLSNPAGQTRFDDVTVTDSSNRLTLVVPYSGIDVNGTLRAATGEYNVEIRNMGTNSTIGKSVVQLTAV